MAIRTMPKSDLISTEYKFMLAKVFSGAVYGVDAYTVEIEVNSGHGEP
ncbi:MAG: hypothetical protein H8E68_08710, partial [Kiritimatiellaeota bacterium]|nr:hypothetical protein [Kiritimatiellota bacterium]